MEGLANYSYFYKQLGKFIKIRKTIALYIFENIDTKLDKAAVAVGIYTDADMYELRPDELRNDLDYHLNATFQMDGHKHSLFGHDDADSFRLNFLEPLLLEAGFKLSNEIPEILENRTLHPEENDYIKRCMTIPRSLKSKCRASLRKHYKGRKIHKFVERSNIPQTIKYFILLRLLLKTVLANLLMYCFWRFRMHFRGKFKVSLEGSKIFS